MNENILKNYDWCQIISRDDKYIIRYDSGDVTIDQKIEIKVTQVEAEKAMVDAETAENVIVELLDRDKDKRDKGKSEEKGNTKKIFQSPIAVIIIGIIALFQIARIISKSDDIAEKRERNRVYDETRELESITGFRRLKKEDIAFTEAHGWFFMGIGFDMMQKLETKNDSLFCAFSNTYGQDNAKVTVRLIPYDKSLALLDNWQMDQKRTADEKQFQVQSILSKSDSTVEFAITSRDKSLIGFTKLFRRDTLLYEACGVSQTSYKQQYEEAITKMIRSFRLVLSKRY